MWLSLTGLLPGLTLSPEDRRRGLTALAEWFHQHLAPHLDAAEKALAGDLTFPLPFPPQPGSPYHEPSFALAAELGLPESKLNLLLREISGLTAREWWDYLRVSDALVAKLRREIRVLLGAQLLVPHDRDGCSSPEHFLKMLHAARRERGWTVQVRAWRLGYRNAARLNRAVWSATGRSLRELEAEVLYQECNDWNRVQAERPSPTSGEGRNERRESGVRAAAAQHHVQHFSAPAAAPSNPQSEIRNPQSVEPVPPLRRTGKHLGPNDRCPCGSGRKHKKCCGRLGAVA